MATCSLPSISPSAPIPLAPRTQRKRPLVEAFLAAHSALTLEAYRRDLDDFRCFLEARNLNDAAQQLLAQGPGPANELAFAYRAALQERGLAPATINCHLSALRSLVRFARLLGLVSWSLEVPSLRNTQQRDTRGPGSRGVRRMLTRLSQRQDRKGKRDRAILRLLYDLALRRSELLQLDYPRDLDLEAGTVSILGKGRSGREKLTLPEPTKAALRDWLQERGLESGPLFLNCDRGAGRGKRLSGASLHALIRKLGRSVGLQVWPHALRHASITAALDLTCGDVRAVRHFSRHRDVRVLLVYDDARTDMAGEIAARVAANLGSLAAGKGRATA